VEEEEAVVELGRVNLAVEALAATEGGAVGLAGGASGAGRSRGSSFAWAAPASTPLPSVPGSSSLEGTGPMRKEEGGWLCTLAAASVVVEEVGCVGGGPEMGEAARGAVALADEASAFSAGTRPLEPVMAVTTEDFAPMFSFG